MMIILFVVWSNYRDLQIMKRYRNKIIRTRTHTQAHAHTHTQSLSNYIYPWWHASHDNFMMWNMNRRQYFFHPRHGWYISPFAF